MAITTFTHITNPLVTSTQLVKHREQSAPEDQSANFAQSILTQSAGVLLRLPQEVIATALVLLQRYQVNNTKTQHATRTISAATIYLAAKLSFTPVAPRSVINVYVYLLSKTASPLQFINSASNATLDHPPDASSYYVSEGTYEREKQKLFTAETQILAALSFDTSVALPHGLALTYIQALGVSSSSPRLAQRVLEHLNGGLTSPQLIYLTHQPNALAVAAIYLAARQIGVKLVEENWWEVFDVDREDLGFLVLAFGSLEGFAMSEREMWSGRTAPLID